MSGVAIIGAGICGLRCAEVLHTAGVTVQLFDKGRGVGGRLATRRHRHWRFDHGAPSLHGDDAGWSARISDYPTWACSDNSIKNYLPENGVNQLAKDVAGHLNVQLNCQIQNIDRRAEGWHLLDSDASMYGAFETLIITAPCPQTLALIETLDPPLCRQLTGVRMTPAWVIMLVSAAPIIAVPELRPTHGLIRRISTEHSKPGRALDPVEHSYVVETTGDWSQQHEDDCPAAIETNILSALTSITTTAVNPKHCAVHRWRYAHTEQPLGRPYLIDQQMKLAVAGDWCLGEGASGAYQSGEALAKALLDSESDLVRGEQALR
tara:strand:+ start:199 stop:1161 length:963 start_codon:yes stop_codon:yes gene_type:complete